MKIGSVWLAALAAASMVAAGSSTAIETVAAAAALPTDQLIVRLARYEGSAAQIGISDRQLRALRNAAGADLRRVREMSGRARVLALPEETPLGEVVRISARLSAVRGVDYAEPDRIMLPMFEPNDPRYVEQWHYFEAIGGINAPAAWDISTGSPDIVVAVIDTGILDHADLAGQTVPGYDMVSNSRKARDGDGRDPDPTDEGDFCFRFLSPISSWHGTHVAGTVGAATDNGLGVAGVSFSGKVQAVRALAACGGTLSDIVDAIRWAAGLSVPDVPANETPARVINMSLGGGGSCAISYQEAIDDAVDAGTTVVVAAGNSDANAADFQPASCDNVVAVAANNREGNRAFYSNFGPVVDVTAPGGETSPEEADGVLSTLDGGRFFAANDDDYAFYQGTSMASPHVAGVAALILAVDPSLTPAEVEAILKETARPFPEGSGCIEPTPKSCGAGIVDAAAALEMSLGQIPPPN